MLIHHTGIIANTWCAQTHRSLLFNLFRRRLLLSNSFSSVSCTDVNNDLNNFLPWLEEKARMRISSVLIIGNSLYGKGLYASEDIQPGDCLLKVPFRAQISANNLPPKITCSLGDDVSNIAKVALVLLREKGLGRSSEWARYMSCLPEPEDLHSTIFWSEGELEMIRPSGLYEETHRQKDRIQKDFLAVKSVIDGFPECFQNVNLPEFVYAYSLVMSRAWEGSKAGVSIIPFADFFNHEVNCESYVLCDEVNQCWEVIADRSYTAGDEVHILYGEFSNAVLLLDFGFTISSNHYDQVQIKLSGDDDGLYAKKMELLERYRTRSTSDVNGFTCSGNIFTIKKVRGGSRKGVGIPQSLLAFGRIMTCSSEQELNAMAKEATESDGRLARNAFKNKCKEIEAHQFLLHRISQLIEEHDKYIEMLIQNRFGSCRKSVLRRRMAEDLLCGEIAVLKSASTWLDNYCSTLMTG